MMNRSSRRLVLSAAALAVVAALILGAVFLLGIPDGLRLSKLLKTTAVEDTFDCSLSLVTNRSGEEIRVDTTLFRRFRDGAFLYGCDTDPVCLFFSGGRLIFDNGRAFDLGNLIPVPQLDTQGLVKMLPFAGVHAEASDAQTVYRLELDAEKLRRVSAEFSESAVLTARFTEEDDVLTAIHLNLRDGSHRTELSLTRTADPDRLIAEEVWNAIDAENVQTIEVFTPLVNALRQVSAANPKCAELEVTADCGPIALTDTMALYGTDSGLFLERRGALKPLEATDLSDQALVGLLYSLCRDGKFSRVGNSGSYSLIFPASKVRDACVEMLPEIERLPITYEDGSLVVSVEDDALYQVRLDIGGKMSFLSIALGMELRPVPPESVILPDGIS